MSGEVAHGLFIFEQCIFLGLGSIELGDGVEFVISPIFGQNSLD